MRLIEGIRRRLEERSRRNYVGPTVTTSLGTFRKGEEVWDQKKVDEEKDRRARSMGRRPLTEDQVADRHYNRAFDRAAEAGLSEGEAERYANLSVERNLETIYREHDAQFEGNVYVYRGHIVRGPEGNPNDRLSPDEVEEWVRTEEDPRKNRRRGRR